MRVLCFCPVGFCCGSSCFRTAKWSGTWQVADDLYAIPSGTTQKNIAAEDDALRLQERGFLPDINMPDWNALDVN